LMPEYNVAIAVNRQSPNWVEFFDYALPRYVREERHRLVEMVNEFHSETIGFLQDLINERQGSPSIRKVADHFLCLDDFGIDRLPEWEPILSEVRSQCRRSVETGKKTEK